MASQLQPAGQAPKGAAATEQPTNTQIQGNNSSSTLYANMEAAPATGEDSNNANDSGFSEDDKSHTLKNEYTDFQLFSDNLPEIDPDMDKFFADADADADASQASASFFDNDTSYDSGVEVDRDAPGTQIFAQDDNTMFSDTVHTAILSGVSDAVFEIMQDFSTPMIPAYIASPVSNEISLPRWVGTYHRHEDMAYLHEQLPHPIRELELQ